MFWKSGENAKECATVGKKKRAYWDESQHPLEKILSARASLSYSIAIPFKILMSAMLMKGKKNGTFNPILPWVKLKKKKVCALKCIWIAVSEWKGTLILERKTTETEHKLLHSFCILLLAT